jgi:hypothetical protein
VWVDPEGACQNGHGPECVGGIYDAEEKLPSVEPVEADFGEGDLPIGLHRFNWGAFLLPLPWGVGFGAWSVVTLWMLMTMVPIGLSVIVGSFGQDVFTANILTIGIVSEVISGGIRLWIGANANRLLWVREHMRLKFVEGSHPRFSIAKYLGRQRMWTHIGIWLTGFILMSLAFVGLSSDPIILQAREQWNIGPRDAALSAFWLVAEAGLGLWLAGKMRDERTVQLPPTQEV